MDTSDNAIELKVEKVNKKENSLPKILIKLDREVLQMLGNPSQVAIET